MTAAAVVRALVLGWWAHPAGAPHRLTQAAAMLGATLSPQGLAQRFTPAAAALLDGVPAAATPAAVRGGSATVAWPDGLAPDWAGRGGRVPRGGQAARKLAVRRGRCPGRLGGPARTAGRAQGKASSRRHAPLPPGALRVTGVGGRSRAVPAGSAA